MRGQGVMVHSIDCEALADFEDQPDRWMDLHWDHLKEIQMDMCLELGWEAWLGGE